MDVHLIDSLRTWHGEIRLSYINHSPNTLSGLWFRLPPEALRGDSRANRVYHRGRKGRLDKVPLDHWGECRVHAARVNGIETAFEQDGSVGFLPVDGGIEPGEKVETRLKFHTKFPAGRASFRIGYARGQYKGAYWFPTLCPYTEDYGWVVNRYYGTAEGFSELADYTVRYTVPSHFIVASTGELVNQDEVLPAERLRSLTPGRTPYPEIAQQPGDSLTWIYHAEKVPDIAFAADPRFLIDIRKYDTFEAWAFIRRGREKDWHNAAELIGWTVEELEKIYGSYPWPRVYATDSWSAMEYPMLTMMTSRAPDYAYVMIHEVVHNYTPMILHSSSVDEPVWDEGFTTFIEHELTEKWVGFKRNRSVEKTRGLFSKTFMVRDDVLRGRRPYLESVLDGLDQPMVRGADPAQDYWQLRVSTYYKTPVMLNALRGVLGEEAFWNGLREFYRRHNLSLVRRTDVTSSIEAGARCGLEWFFHQFLDSADDIDYRLKHVRSANGGESEIINAVVERVGGIRLPVLMGVETVGGDTLYGRISFLKTDRIPDGEELWGSWDQVHEPVDTVHVRIELPPGVKARRVMLDPKQHYTDRNPLDNVWPDLPIQTVFDTRLLPLPEPPVDAYRLQIYPGVGYNSYQGVSGGIGLKGSFMERESSYQAEVYVPSRNMGDDPRFRLSLFHPVLRTFQPPRGYMSVGSMHMDRWIEGGFTRQWSHFRNGDTRLDTRIGVGKWWRVEESVSNESYPESSADSYFHLQVGLSRLKGWKSLQQTFTWTEGLGDAAYYRVGWQASDERPLPFAWSTAFDARVTYQDSEVPFGFRSSPTAGSLYCRRGEPLWGAQWHNNGAQSVFPQSHTNASFAHMQHNVAVRSFIGMQLGLHRNLPRMLSQWNYRPLKRFMERLRWGGYAVAARYHAVENGVDVSAWEAGVMLGLLDLYGVSFHARLPMAWSQHHDDERDAGTLFDSDEVNFANLIQVQVELHTSIFTP
ncbi:hypothetical protein GF324_01450 [bacterium]|nr:hypothetical protein [bacterium]